MSANTCSLCHRHIELSGPHSYQALLHWAFACAAPLVSSSPLWVNPGPGVPSLLDLLMIWGGASVMIIEVKCTINKMHFNRPQTTLHTRLWKNYLARNLVPGAEKGWGLVANTAHPWSLSLDLLLLALTRLVSLLSVSVRADGSSQVAQQQRPACLWVGKLIV